MSSEIDKRIPAALLILRFFLAVFLLQWSIEKLILPSAAASIARNFYGVTLPEQASYALGIAELVVSLALLFGFYRTISYGLSLLIHTVTVIVSRRQLFDPYGLAKVGSHLWIATWPTWWLCCTVPDANMGYLDHRWLATVAKRTTVRSGNETGRSGTWRAPDCAQRTIDRAELGSMALLRSLPENATLADLRRTYAALLERLRPPTATASCADPRR
jgi:putative oxidoreductase